MWERERQSVQSGIVDMRGCQKEVYWMCMRERENSHALFHFTLQGTVCEKCLCVKMRKCEFDYRLPATKHCCIIVCTWMYSYDRRFSVRTCGEETKKNIEAKKSYYKKREIMRMKAYMYSLSSLTPKCIRVTPNISNNYLYATIADLTQLLRIGCSGYLRIP